LATQMPNMTDRPIGAVRSACGATPMSQR